MSKPAAPSRARPARTRSGLRPSHLKFPVVGIGASAGGLQAVIKFLEQMPSDCGMAIVVIMHLSAKHESSAGAIMQRATRMPVRQVNSPVPLEKNHVYVISPAMDLSMDDGRLRVSEPAPRHGGHVAVDLFFRTLAEVHRERAFCVILSGTGSDGAVGLSSIKEQGGVTLAQSPDDAEFDGMPQSAIATGNVDLVLPVVEMPQKLMEIWRNASTIRMPDVEPPQLPVEKPSTESEAAAAELALREILTLLFDRTGHNFRHYKRATVLRRVERRMQVNAQPDLPSYLAFFREHPPETQGLLDDLLIGVTNFFRDRESFEALEREVIPRLFRANEPLFGNDSANIRAWSAGCSTGEEAYSLAMLLVDQGRIEANSARVQVFATDIDARAISVGRAGIYSGQIVTDVPPTRLREYFVKSDGRYEVKKEIREKILFAQHSLLRDPPFSRLHLISCRNLLIYLDREVQREILQMFHFALNPGGYLFLGTSESADVCSELFVPVDKKNRIFRAKLAQRNNRPLPHLPTSTDRRQRIPAPVQQPEVRKQSFADIHQRVLEQYAPPSVIVDTNAEIVHMSDRAGHFLRYVGGEPSHNLLTLIHPALRLELRTALFQAVHSGKSVEARRVKLKRDGRTFFVNMIARPFKEEAFGDYVLVLFDEVEDTMSSDATEPHAGAKDSVLSQLEEELQRTKLQLQNTLEQSRLSTEELKASNEELQAINEELRSATEELETSKEELQSINEELITVNHELKVKVEETDQINDDLQNLITSTDIATVFVDRGMRIKWFTPRSTDIFSMLPVDAGRSLLDITHRLNYDDLASDATRVFESLTPTEREVRSQDGRHFLSRILPYRTAEDHIEGAVLTFIDISALRSAKEGLRLSEERLQLVMESAGDYAIIVQDTEGLITSWNKGAEMIFGYTRDEVIGRTSDFIFVPEDRAARVPESELSRARDCGRAEDERWHLRKDGSRFYCSGVVNLLGGDSFSGYVKIARDLTDRQQLIDAQKNKLAETQTASLLKDQFFAVMSHELKHPLNLIQLNAEVLARLPVAKATPMIAKSIRTIRDAVSSQARIIDDLLDVSRVRTGKLKLSRGPVNLCRLLLEIADMVRANGHSAELSLDLPDEPLILDADPTRVEQIAWNLINNALKFTPEGGLVKVSAAIDDTFARLDVQDNGQGIAREFLDKVFDLFGQAETQHARLHKEGLGIGLSLVRQLAEAHNGRVEVHSEGLGRGSHFSVWLPLFGSNFESPTSPEVLDDGACLSGSRVLLIDDSQEVLEVMEMLLQGEGAEVVSCDSAHQALKTAGEQSFDLVISDIGMPQMSGYEFIQALRELPAYASVPTIAMSGYSGAGDVAKALQAGFDKHLGKPVSYEDLVDTIMHVRGTPS